jgi:hypothetical protein
MPRRKDLQCNVWGLEYDFKERMGTLRVARDQRCDMGACFALFEKIDPKVTKIYMVADRTLDVVYTRNGKSWKVHLPMVRTKATGRGLRNDIPRSALQDRQLEKQRSHHRGDLTGPRDRDERETPSFSVGNRPPEVWAAASPPM